MPDCKGAQPSSAITPNEQNRNWFRLGELSFFAVRRGRIIQACQQVPGDIGYAKVSATAPRPRFTRKPEGRRQNGTAGWSRTTDLRIHNPHRAFDILDVLPLMSRLCRIQAEKSQESSP